jgi:hypothetical protein
MSQLRPKGERVGEIAAKAAVQLLFSTGKSFTVDGLREKLREFLPAGCPRGTARRRGAQQCGTHSAAPGPVQSARGGGDHSPWAPALRDHNPAQPEKAAAGTTLK